MKASKCGAGGGCKIGEPRGLLRSIRERRWRIIGHTLRHEEALHHTILEGKIEGERGRGCRRTTIKN